ncbi:MAG: hypothetical protein AB7G62_11780 [Magnetospirillum sp.]
MSTSRIGAAPGVAPSSPTVSQHSSGDEVAPAPSGDQLALALDGLAEDLLRDTRASRLTRAQSQVEALHYAAQLALARGDLWAIKALSSEAQRIGRDLAAAGLPAEQVAPILEQARRVGGAEAPPDDTA